MIDPRFLQVLHTIHERLSDSAVSWALTGSLGFALQGVPVEPHDIDIQTDEVGAYAIEERLSEWVSSRVNFSSTERIRSHFGALTIGGIRVEIMGAIQKRLEDGTWEDPVDLACHKRIVEVEGMRVPVLSLEYEVQAYRKLGRFERAALLEEWLRRDADRRVSAASESA
ncbi:MAG TPA: hypothetical protein DEP84_28370 [Chloroflexi bacterium]|nr:hypothetical protein [Chloroflexota bacterium]